MAVFQPCRQSHVCFSAQIAKIGHLLLILVSIAGSDFSGKLLQLKVKSTNIRDFSELQNAWTDLANIVRY